MRLGVVLDEPVVQIECVADPDERATVRSFLLLEYEPDRQKTDTGHLLRTGLQSHTGGTRFQRHERRIVVADAFGENEHRALITERRRHKSECLRISL